MKKVRNRKNQPKRGDSLSASLAGMRRKARFMLPPEGELSQLWLDHCHQSLKNKSKGLPVGAQTITLYVKVIVCFKKQYGIFLATKNLHPANDSWKIRQRNT